MGQELVFLTGSRLLAVVLGIMTVKAQVPGKWAPRKLEGSLVKIGHLKPPGCTYLMSGPRRHETASAL